MDDEHDLTGDELNNFDWTRWHYEGKHFEARAVNALEATMQLADWLAANDKYFFLISGRATASSRRRRK